MLIGRHPRAGDWSIRGHIRTPIDQTAGSSRVSFARLALEELAEALGDLGVGDPLEAAGGNGGDGRVDASHHVGAAGGRVLVGRLVEALDGQLDGSSPVEALPVAQLDGRPGVTATGAGGVEVALFVPAPGEVVLEDAPDPPAQVV